MYKINVTNAVINSVIQKLCHTPVEPINRFKIKAKPSITKIYRNIEIIKEENPLPKASRLPDTVIDTEEITEEMAKTGSFFGLQIHGDSCIGISSKQTN